MLKFYQNTTNINPFKASKYGILASDKKLLPFQFVIKGYDPNPVIVDFQLRNSIGDIIDLAGDKNLIVRYDGIDYYFIFNGQTDLVTLIKQGIWQIYIKISTDYGNIFLYSNYFEIYCENEILGKLEFWNKTDLGDEIFQTGYKKILYLNRQILVAPPFTKITATELMSGEKRYEYEITADGYTTTIFGNNETVEVLNDIILYDTFRVTFDRYSNKKLFKRPDINISNEKNYTKILINFYINPKERTLCEQNQQLATPPWILATGYWNNGGIWVDTETWID